MFALCSDSHKGSWRHAETLLATSGEGKPRATSGEDVEGERPNGPAAASVVVLNFLFFSSNENSKVGKITNCPKTLSAAAKIPATSYKGR